MLKVARETVAQMQGDRAATLSSMAAPMVGMMQQIGIKEPDKAQVLVQEVVMPTLSAHYDELLDIQARGFATVLGKDDLQAIAAFYATPAGKRLAAAQPQLAQIQLAGMQQWMQAVAPEMQGKLIKAVQAHGWTAGAKRNPSEPHPALSRNLSSDPRVPGGGGRPGRLGNPASPAASRTAARRDGRQVQSRPRQRLPAARTVKILRPR
ncbi:DUF2059 domain-containing protein [Methylobacterium tardum]|uniref:DUF2059 domain-containing protein n=1 Tax=Methylobacterium tardum TaxID=374432 RepID=UPI003609CBA2